MTGKGRETLCDKEVDGLQDLGCDDGFPPAPEELSGGDVIPV